MKKYLPRKYIIPLLILTISFALCSEEIPVVYDEDSSKNIISFVLRADDNSDLEVDVAGVVNESSIFLEVPYETDISSLVPEIVYTGTSISPASGEPVNLTKGSVTYTVTAVDMTKKDYSLSVAKKSSADKEILSFEFKKEDNSDKLKYDYTCNINQNTGEITVTVPNPYPIDPNIIEYPLEPTIVHNGISITPGNEEEVDFWFSKWGPVKYTVTAEDGTTRDYFVKVDHDLDWAKEIDASDFGFLGVDPAEYIIEIVDDTEVHKNIFINITDNNDITSLIPEITLPDTAGVSGSASIEPSMDEPLDFTNPVSFVITAADSTYMAYTVYVTDRAEGNSFTSFKLPASLNGALSTDVNGVIDPDNLTVSLTVPHGTDPGSLIANFSVDHVDSTVEIGGVTQTSGVTPNNFTFGSAKLYDIIPDTIGQTKSWSVTVYEAPDNANDLTAFNIPIAINPALSGLTKEPIVEFDGTDINVTILSNGIDLSDLIATFSSTGDSITVDGVPQQSAVTHNDFTAPVVYTVHAQDTTTKDYTVTVTAEADTACDITAFNIPLNLNPGKGIMEDPVVRFNGQNITVYFKYLGTTLTGLKATFTTTGEYITVGGVTQESGITINNFNSPVTYTVHAQDVMVTKDYTITAVIRETIQSLRPNAQGSETEIPEPGNCSCCWYWTWDRCGNPDDDHYTEVDDPVGSPDYDATYVENNLGNYCNGDFRDLYNLPAPSFNSSSQITKIVVNYIVKRTSYDTWARSWASVRTGSSTYDGPPTGDGISLPSKDTWYTYSYEWTNNPKYSTPWTWDTINSLEIGIKLGNHLETFGHSNIRCTQVYVNVYYIPPIP